MGVELRLPPQGLIDSTAEARYDFSAFLSPGAGLMVPVRPEGHPNAHPGTKSRLTAVRERSWLRARLPKVSIGALLRTANVRT